MEPCRLLGHSPGGFHRIAYSLWRPPGRVAGAAVCVHGLTRNGRDFDALAAALADAGWLVACPDVVGRGDSGWLADPAGYGYPQYLADMTALIARLGVDEIDWIGTSMGGLIGMMMAAQPQTPIRRLVMNDIGPFIPKAAIERIASYVGRDPSFADLAEAEAYLRQVHAPFRITDEQWRRLAAHSVSPAEDGRLRLRYDPGIAAGFAESPFEDIDLWALWDGIAVPTLVLRGAESDLLPPATAAEMTVRGPKAEVIEIPGCGHAPMLMDEAQISTVRDWLSAV
jgi:pimeloyl-ACP methyl ester carboxylesterase